MGPAAPGELLQAPAPHPQAGVKLARRHDEHLDGRTWFRVLEDRPLRYAIEIRNDTFVSEEFIALLRKHAIALVAADTVEWPLLMDITADFVYCRLHGSEQLYVSGYDREAIDRWARRVVQWSRGGEVENGRKASSANAKIARARDVYVYFDNDAKVKAPFDALELRKCVAAMQREDA